MCATIVGQAVVPLVGGKGHRTRRQTTSRKHWRYGATRVCCSGWRSPLLTGGASLVRIFLLSRGPRSTPESGRPCLPRTPLGRSSLLAPTQTAQAIRDVRPARSRAQTTDWPASSVLLRLCADRFSILQAANLLGSE